MNKKALLALMLVIMLVFGSMGVYADQHMEEEVESNTIVDIALADENFSILVAALIEADLVETLQGEGPFTVFAPTDEAFLELLEALEIEAADLLAHPQLADVLLYHVVAGAVMSTDLEDGMEAETVGGETIVFDLEDGVFVNDAEVIDPDIEADNGVIHVIDSVLVPESFVLEVEEEEEEDVIAEPVARTIILEVDNPIATINGDMMTLDVAPFIGAGDRTLVPLRFVSEALGFEVEWDGDARMVTIMDGDQVAVEMVIDSRNAVVYGEATELEVAPIIHYESSRTVVPLRFVSETLGYDVDWDGETRIITITTEAAVETNTIVDIALADENFSILVAALIEADLVGVLQGEGPFTVCAPTDDAFLALLEDLGIEAEDLLAHPQLEEVLLYHVVSGAVMAGDLEDGMVVETVGGESVTISLEDGVFINASEVIQADIVADNGVIHVIDSVLVPESFELEAEEDDMEEENGY